MEMPQWTKDRPVESGFYWYREEGGSPEVVEWSQEQEVVMRPGDDRMIGDGYFTTIDGEFWPEAIRQPDQEPTRAQLIYALKELCEMCSSSYGWGNLDPNIEDAWVRAEKVLKSGDLARAE